MINFKLQEFYTNILVNFDVKGKQGMFFCFVVFFTGESFIVDVATV